MSAISYSTWLGSLSMSCLRGNWRKSAATFRRSKLVNVVVSPTPSPFDAEIPFDWGLQDVMAKSGMVDFVMAEPARCPACSQ